MCMVFLNVFDELWTYNFTFLYEINSFHYFHVAFLLTVLTVWNQIYKTFTLSVNKFLNVSLSQFTKRWVKLCYVITFPLKKKLFCTEA
jgi:hypothetical protein